MPMVEINSDFHPTLSRPAVGRGSADGLCRLNQNGSKLWRSIVFSLVTHPQGVVMNKTYSVAVLVGSLRKASINRNLALALTKLAPPPRQPKIIETGKLPQNNEDIDQDIPPAAYKDFRSQLQAADA